MREADRGNDKKPVIRGCRQILGHDAERSSHPRMRLIKLQLNSFEKASRDRREMSVAKSLGYDITVLNKGDEYLEHVVDGIKVIDCPTSKRYCSTTLNHIDSFVQRVRWVRSFNCDVISCRDLIALLIGWCAGWFKTPKPILIYDAHELNTALNRAQNMVRLRNFISIVLERFLICRCAFTISVNDSIADEMVKLHHLSKRPLVVRNIPALWKRDEKAVTAARAELCAALGIEMQEGRFIVMHHGYVYRGRGLEQLIEALNMLPDVYCVIMGNGDSALVEELREQANRKAPGRVTFIPAVPNETLEPYVAAADLGILVTQSVSRNNYFTLPNKFFENIQAETPLVVPDFPEVSRITEEYGVGIVCDSSDPASIASGIRHMRDDRDYYATCKHNLGIAKQELCWERERTVLEDAYAELMRDHV